MYAGLVNLYTCQRENYGQSRDGVSKVGHHPTPDHPGGVPGDLGRLSGRLTLAVGILIPGFQYDFTVFKYRTDLIRSFSKLGHVS